MTAVAGELRNAAPTRVVVLWVIEVYRTEEGSELTDQVEETLRGLVLDHSIHVVPDPSAAPSADLPAIREGERVVNPAELPGYLEELRRFVADWNRFQSDACYIDVDGKVC